MVFESFFGFWGTRLDELLLALTAVLIVSILASFWSLIEIYKSIIAREPTSALLVYRNGTMLETLWIDRNKGGVGAIVSPEKTVIVNVHQNLYGHR